MTLPSPVRVQEVRVEERPGLAGQRPPLRAQVIVAIRETHAARRADSAPPCKGSGRRWSGSAHRFPERHQQAAGHLSGLVDREEQVLVGIHARRRTEEVAERRSDAFLAVETDFQQQECDRRYGPAPDRPISGSRAYPAPGRTTRRRLFPRARRADGRFAGRDRQPAG